MAEALAVLCPVCLTQSSVARDIKVTERINCNGCERVFEFQNALPVKKRIQTRTLPDRRASRRGLTRIARPKSGCSECPLRLASCCGCPIMSRPKTV